MPISKGLVALTIASIALLSGCGQTRQTSETSTETPAAVPAVPSPEPTASGWVAELHQEEAALAHMVEEGRLGEVHGQAVKLQAVLTRIGEQAKELTPAQQQQLNEHIRGANVLVDEIHDAGDAGDLTKIKAKHQEFQTHLRAIEGVFGVATP